MSRSNLKKFVFPLSALIIFAVVTLIFTEIFLQIIYAYKENLKETVLEKVVRSIEPPFSWERHFIESYAKDTGSGFGPLITKGEGLYEPHPTRGWNMRANISQVLDNNTYTSNVQGFRAPYDYAYDDKRYGVLIVGDSFTFGDGVDDGFTWPNQLQELGKGLNVFNVAGSGYGIDQMYITLSETISLYKPRLVIAAFINNNLARSMLDFRDYKKPRFILDDRKKLKLTNSPIGSLAEIEAELSEGNFDNYSRIQLVNLYNSLRGKLITSRGDRPECDHECLSINERLFMRMSALAKKYKTDFIMLYLPNSMELYSAEGITYGQYFFEEYAKLHKGLYLNMRSEMLGKEVTRTVGGHYLRSGNAVVANSVYRMIKTLPSWKRDLKEQVPDNKK